MALNLNKVILGGRLTADPELKTTPSGVSVTNFTIAVDRKGKDAPTDFLDCVAWRQTAEFITKYFSKGNAIGICGSLQKRYWEAKDGERRSATEVVADEAFFVDSKSDAQGTQTYTADPRPTPTFTKPVEPKFEELSTDDDLPF